MILVYTNYLHLILHSLRNFQNIRIQIKEEEVWVISFIKITSIFSENFQFVYTIYRLLHKAEILIINTLDSTSLKKIQISIISIALRLEWALNLEMLNRDQSHVEQFLLHAFGKILMQQIVPNNAETNLWSWRSKKAFLIKRCILFIQFVKMINCNE